MTPEPPRNLAQYWRRVCHKALEEIGRGFAPQNLLGIAVAVLACSVMISAVYEGLMNPGLPAAEQTIGVRVLIGVGIAFSTFVLLAVFVVKALFLVPYAMWREATDPAPPVSDEDQLSRSVPVVGMNIALGHVDHASPWLYFGGYAFNGSGGPIQMHSASGRIEIAGIGELQQSIELNPKSPITRCEQAQFLQFQIRVPLNDNAAAQLRQQRDSKGGIAVFFKDASVVARTESGTMFKLRIPRPVTFEVGHGWQDPRLLNSVIQEKY